MHKIEKPVLNILKRKEVGRMPVWLMRQAGRYLPEYRELRSKADSFISFCLSPELAAEATLQPIRRYGMDAAILFADILLVPYGLHQPMAFKEGEGPVLDPLTDTHSLAWSCERLEPVFETIQRVKEELPEQTSFIGFSGGLWTVACYMLEGRGQTGFRRPLSLIKENPALLHGVLDILHHATLEYLGRQIEAGVEVIQIFESHAGLLEGKDFEEFVIKPTAKLVLALKAEYPEIPVIGFPRGAKEKDYEAYAERTGVDSVSLDQSVSLSFAKTRLQTQVPLQGNLDPHLLLQGGAAMKTGAEKIFKELSPQHIFNLGHGVIKETPPENVAELVNFVRNLT